MKMQVIISVGGVFHSYHTARAAQRAGCLKRYITTRFYPERAKGIDHSLVISMPLLEYGAYVLRKIPLINNTVPWNWVKDSLFDIMASRYVDECDILHVWNNYGLFSLRKAKEYGAKIIIQRGSAHPLIQQRLLTEEYEKYGLKFSLMNQRLIQRHVKEYEEADFVMVPSRFAYDSMIEERVPEQKLLRVTYGVDIEQFKPSPKRDKKFRVIFVGMASLQKGTHYLLEAMKQLSLPKAELILIGSMRDNFRSILARYKGTFNYIGAVDRQAIPRYYADSSVFVLPSIQDGFARVVTEAMASGLPVIVSENVGAKDIVRDGTDGFIIPIRDVEALKEKILFFYENEGDRQRMGESAREYVKQFTWERYGRELIEIYQKAVPQK